MSRKSFWVGATFLFLMVCWMIEASVGISRLFDLPSLIIVIGLVFFGTLMSCGFKQIVKAASKTLKGEAISNREELTDCIRVLQKARVFAWMAGVIGTIQGMAGLLYDIRDYSSLGVSLVIMMLTLFYGILLAELVFAPCKTYLISRSKLSLDDKLSIEKSISCGLK